MFVKSFCRLLSKKELDDQDAIDFFDVVQSIVPTKIITGIDADDGNKVNIDILVYTDKRGIHIYEIILNEDITVEEGDEIIQILSEEIESDFTFETSTVMDDTVDESVGDFYHERVDPDALLELIQSGFNKKYKGTKLYSNIESDDVWEVITVSTAPDVSGATQWAVGGSMVNDVKDDFSLSLNAYQSSEGNDVVIEDATAGKYKGAVGIILKTIFDYLGTDSTQNLVIKHDTSGGAWKHLADKLNVEYVNDSNY